jgi:hypothetical protein
MAYVHLAQHLMIPIMHPGLHSLLQKTIKPVTSFMDFLKLYATVKQQIHKSRDVLTMFRNYVQMNLGI